MRHLLLIGTLALTTLLAACSAHDDGADQTGMNQTETVSFTADVSSTTRSVINSLDDFKTAGQFRVWAWMTDDGGVTNYPMSSDANHSPLQAVDVTWNAAKNAWQTAQTYYWPRPRYTVDFYAVYPTDAPFDPATKSLDYNSGTTTLDDVMYAIYSGQRDGTETSEIAKPVSLHFQHPLCLVQFQANRTNEFDVQLTSIELCNVYSKGIFTLPTPSNNETKGGWSNLNNLTSYNVPLKEDIITLTTTMQNVTPDGYIMALIPQTRPQWATSESSQVTIDVNNALEEQSRGCYLKLGCSIKFAGIEADYADNGYVYCPCPLSLEAGKHYTYHIGFGTGYHANGTKTITEISLSVSVTDWEPGGTDNNADTVIYI